MKAWMKLEIVSRIFILTSVGFQFLILQPANDEFQNIKQQKIEDAINKSSEKFQYLSKKIEALDLLTNNTESIESIEIPKEGIIIAAKAVVEIKKCTKFVIGEQRTSNIYRNIPNVLNDENLVEETGKIIEKIDEKELDDILDCFLEPYYELGAEVVIDMIQEISTPLIEESIVKPIFVIYHNFISWFNFVLFFIGSILAVIARTIELKPEE